MSEKPEVGPVKKRSPQWHFLFMCGTQYNQELDSAAGPLRVFNSLDGLKAHEPCWERCGIVQVEVRFKRWCEENSLESDSHHRIDQAKEVSITRLLKRFFIGRNPVL